MAQRKPAYLSAASSTRADAPPPMSQAGQMSDTSRAQAAAHYQSLPSLQTNVPTNAGPGPVTVSSPQWKAVTGAVPAGPHVPGVWIQHFTGIDHSGIARNSYGDVYAGPPTQALAWEASDGWQYAIYTDYTIKVLRSMPHGTVPANALNGTVFAPGSRENYNIIKQWFSEQARHPVGTSSTVFMQRAAAASRAAGGGGDSLASTLRGAVSSMISVVTGSSSDVPPPPPAPTQAPAVTYATAPDGSMVQVPVPTESKAKKVLPYVGGLLLAAGTLGGLYWYFGADKKRTNGSVFADDGDDDSGGKDAE